MAGPRSGDYFLGRSALSWRDRHQAKSDQLMLVLVLVAVSSAPLSLDIDQILDGDRLDEHSPTAQMHMPHRPGLEVLETGEGLG